VHAVLAGFGSAYHKPDAIVFACWALVGMALAMATCGDRGDRSHGKWASTGGRRARQVSQPHGTIARENRDEGKNLLQQGEDIGRGVS
jgi:hypothetical protein